MDLNGKQTFKVEALEFTNSIIALVLNFYDDKFDILENGEFKIVKIFIQDLKFRVNGTGDKKEKMV